MNDVPYYIVIENTNCRLCEQSFGNVPIICDSEDVALRYITNGFPRGGKGHVYDIISVAEYNRKYGVKQ